MDITNNDAELLKAIHEMYGDRHFSAEDVHHAEKLYRDEQSFRFGKRISESLGGDSLTAVWRTPAAINSIFQRMAGERFGGYKISRAGLDNGRQLWKID